MYSEMLLLALMWNIAPTDQLLTTPGLVLMHPVEERIVAKTNADAKRHGLRALQVDGHLVRSCANIPRGCPVRIRCNTRMPRWARISRWGNNRAPKPCGSWMNSSGHRANILSSSYSKIGVAAYTANDGTVYWCQQFLR